MFGRPLNFRKRACFVDSMHRWEMNKSIFIPEKYDIVICPPLTAMAIFKLQTVNVAQRAKALDSLRTNKKVPENMKGSEKLEDHYENPHKIKCPFDRSMKW